MVLKSVYLKDLFYNKWIVPVNFTLGSNIISAYFICNNLVNMFLKILKSITDKNDLKIKKYNNLVTEYLGLYNKSYK